MRGVEHYREAEALLREFDEGAREIAHRVKRGEPFDVAALTAIQVGVLGAQVHATLALADVTAETQRAGEWPT